MKKEDTNISNSGYKIGDFILIDNGRFGRIVKIFNWIYEKQDYQVKRGLTEEGDVANKWSPMVVQTILSSGFERPKRRSTVQVYDHQIVSKVDKAFVKKMFKNVNDMIVYIKMLNEQERITNE